MDKLVDLLKDYQVGIWCKRAAWIILALTLVQLLLRYFTFFSLTNTASSSLQNVDWFSLFQVLLSSASEALFSFFLLYAAGVAVEYITGSTHKVRDSEPS